MACPMQESEIITPSGLPNPKQLHKFSFDSQDDDDDSVFIFEEDSESAPPAVPQPPISPVASHAIVPARRPAATSAAARQRHCVGTLYIQMQLCDRRTLASWLHTPGRTVDEVC